MQCPCLTATYLYVCHLYLPVHDCCPQINDYLPLQEDGKRAAHGILPASCLGDIITWAGELGSSYGVAEYMEAADEVCSELGYPLDDAESRGVLWGILRWWLRALNAVSFCKAGAHHAKMR